MRTRPGWRRATISPPLLAHGGLVALAGDKVLVIACGVVVVTQLGFCLWPRVFVVLMALCELLVTAAVANNLFWLLHR